jgi:hypothetical protein
MPNSARAPDDFSKYVVDDTYRWAGVIKAHNVRAE